MRPTFALTFDAELMWGSFDRMSAERFERRYPDVRGTIRAILDELDEFGIAATWAVVGHLFLDCCERDASGRTHPQLLRPSHDRLERDRLGADPGTDRLRDPLWYGDDLIEAIQAGRPGHEIGSHSFSHPIFGEPGMTAEVARSELAECVRVARARGITLRSFVFPRNREGHHEVLREFGITAYRGADRTWYGNYPRMAARGAHFLDQGAGIAPRVSQPVERLPGLWDVPGSMLLLHRVGVRRWLSMQAKVHKARSGLRRAIDQEAVFHLWTHPMNLAYERDVMLAGLRSILRDVADLRDRGLIQVATMAEIAEQAEQQKSITIAATRALGAASAPIVMAGSILASIESTGPAVAPPPPAAAERPSPRRRILIFVAVLLALILALGAAMADALGAVSTLTEFLAGLPAPYDGQAPAPAMGQV
jgi:peptidoglycan/xylan/chitin deacetylase (PgdA/CDA1 family)